ncbi:hypothetical protein F4861DRAFT_545707 [Xylaria intraflava]|nr:hypothetical protein F4861DRAFT_545707 [Xylaria intraflava]
MSIHKKGENSAWWDIVVNAALNAVTIIVVALRMYSRKLTGTGFGWDDGCVLIATLLVNSLLLIVGFMISLGFGLPIEEVSRGNFEKMTKLGRAFRLTFILCVCFAKMSALLFYLRVFGTRVLHGNSPSNLTLNTNSPRNSPSDSYIRSSLRSFWSFVRKPSRRLTYISLMFIVVAWSVGNLAQELTVCGAHSPMCVNQRNTDLGVCVFNAVGDLVILALPLWPIWRLQMKTGTKIGLSVVFLLGFVTIVVAFLRFEAIIRTTYGGDYNLTAMRSANYAILEPNLSILCMSLPMLQPFLRKMRGCLAKGVEGWRVRARTFKALFTTHGGISPGGRGNGHIKSPISSLSLNTRLNLHLDDEPGAGCNTTAGLGYGGGERDSVCSGSTASKSGRVCGLGSRETADGIALGTVPVAAGSASPAGNGSFEPLTLTGVGAASNTGGGKGELKDFGNAQIIFDKLERLRGRCGSKVVDLDLDARLRLQRAY